MSKQLSTPSEDRVQVDYTGMSVSYDEHRFHGRKNRYLEMIRQRIVLKQVGAGGRDRKVLDVGCGTGRGLGYLVAGGFRDLTGLDYTQAMLDRAREKLDKQLPSNTITLQQGDAFALPYEPESHDLVISLNFIHLFALKTQKEVMQQLYKVCKPGGRVVVEFENLHHGICMSRAKEQEMNSETTLLNTYDDMKELFPSDMFDSVNISGTDIPIIHRIFRFMPPIGAMAESLLHFAPFNRCGGRFVVSARRI